MLTVDEVLPIIKAAVRELRESDRLPVMLTYRMAAHELSIGLTKLRRLVDNGAIRAKVVGDRKMIPSSEVLKFAEGRHRSGAPPGTYKRPSLSEGEKIRERLRGRR